MEFLIKSIQDNDIVTNNKTNPRVGLHINKKIHTKIEQHRKTLNELGFVDVTQGQIINAALEALNVIKPNDENELRQKLEKEQKYNAELRSSMVRLHRKIINYQKNYVLREAK